MASRAYTIPSFGELAVKVLVPLVLTPIMLVMIPILLLGQSAGSNVFVIGVCPIGIEVPTETRVDGYDVRLVVGGCAEEANALSRNELHSLIHVQEVNGIRKSRVLFKVSRSPGRESQATARKIAMRIDRGQTADSVWPKAIAVDTDLELVVGMLVIVLPALLLQWIFGGIALRLLQAVQPIPMDRTARLHLHYTAMIIALLSAMGFLIGLTVATALGNYINGGAVQMIRELDASVNASPSSASDFEITVAFIGMALSFLALIVPASVCVGIVMRSKVAFSALFQISALMLMTLVMVFGYLSSVDPIPYVEYLPLMSSTDALNDLVRNEFEWMSLLTTLAINMGCGALLFFLSFRVRSEPVVVAASLAPTDQSASPPRIEEAV